MASNADAAFMSELEALGKYESLQAEVKLRQELRLSLASPQLLQQSRANHNANKKSLKSDVKKTSMFVNKLRSINSEGLTQCIRDVETLNLTLYISEIVNALLEISFKPNDVPSIVKLAVSLHKRYDDFSPPFLEKLKSSTLLLTSPQQTANTGSSNTDDNQNQKKKRIQIRLLIELFEVGVFTEEDFFVQLLRQLLGKTKAESKARRQVDLMGLSTFVKYGAEILLGLPSKSLKNLARTTGKDVHDMPMFIAVSSSIANEMRSHVLNVYEEVSSELLKSHKDYKRKERRAETDRLIHGNLTEQKQAEWDAAKKMFERLLGVVTTIAESLGEDVPVLKEDEEEDTQDASSRGITVWDGGNQSAEYTGPFNDIESRSFYEDLPDLLSMVPISLLGLTNEQAATLQEQIRVTKESRYLSPPATIPLPTLGESASIESTSSQDLQEKSDEKQYGSSIEDLNDIDKEDTLVSIGSTDVPEDTPHARVTLLIQDKLPECTSKAKCDDFCQNFCFLNSKPARRKLAQALCKIPWGRGELVASYARIVASLHRIFTDIAPTVLASIQREMTFITKSKSLLSVNQVDTKIRILRYLGELIKFCVAPPIMALKPLKAFLADFSSHNVDFIAALLESCGRFLYLLPYTSERMDNILETMMRLRRSKFLDLRQQTLVDSAYFVVKPPSRTKEVKVELTVIQRYIRYLLLDRLCSKNTSVDNIISSIRRLPFNNVDERVEYYIIKFSLRLARQKYTSIGVLADFLAGIYRYRPNIIVKLVDSLYEEIFRGFDTPWKRDYQRMIGYVRLIGELYNYAVLSSSLIFESLYVFIHYGHSRDQMIVDPSSGESVSTHSYGSYTSPVYSQIITLAFNNGDISLSDQGISGKPSGKVSITNGIDESASKQMKSKLDHFLDVLNNIPHDPSRFDPKIINEIDPVHDSFRAQLVVELVNTCGEYYVKGQAREKLNKFLAYFQRYLMSKAAVPLHIEFAILDMFDMLESYAKAAVNASHYNSASSSTEYFPRYHSLEAIQPIIDAYEMKNKELYTYGSNMMEENDEEEDSGDERDREENDDRNMENSSDYHMSSDDQREESSDEEDDSLSQHELAKLMEKHRLAKEEDDEFEKAFRSVMMESLSGVSKTSNKPNDVDRMAIPAVLPRPKNILRPILPAGGSSINSQATDVAIASAPESSEDPSKIAKSNGDEPVKGGVVFKMLSRDTKGRVETKQLLVPESNPIVIKLQKSEEMMRLEKQKIKEKVLQLEWLHAAGGDEDGMDGNEDYAMLGMNTPYIPTSAPASNTIAPAASSQSGRHRGRGEGRGGRGNSGPSQANTIRSGQYARRGDEFLGKKVMDTLNLDEFLAESAASEIRRMQSNMQNNSYKNR